MLEKTACCTSLRLGLTVVAPRISIPDPGSLPCDERSVRQYFVFPVKLDKRISACSHRIRARNNRQFTLASVSVLGNIVPPRGLLSACTGTARLPGIDWGKATRKDSLPPRVSLDLLVFNEIRIRQNKNTRLLEALAPSVCCSLAHSWAPNTSAHFVLLYTGLEAEPRMLLATRRIEAFVLKCMPRLYPLCERELELELLPGPMQPVYRFRFSSTVDLTHNSADSPLTHTTMVCRDADQIDA